MRLYIYCDPSIGTVSPVSGTEYNSGQSVTVSINPNEGIVFSGWFINGIQVSGTNSYTFTTGDDDVYIFGWAKRTIKTGSTLEEALMSAIDAANALVFERACFADFAYKNIYNRKLQSGSSYMEEQFSSSLYKITSTDDPDVVKNQVRYEMKCYDNYEDPEEVYHLFTVKNWNGLHENSLILDSNKLELRYKDSSGDTLRENYFSFYVRNTNPYVDTNFNIKATSFDGQHKGSLYLHGGTIATKTYPEYHGTPSSCEIRFSNDRGHRYFDIACVPSDNTTSSSAYYKYVRFNTTFNQSQGKNFLNLEALFDSYIIENNYFYLRPYSSGVNIVNHIRLKNNGSVVFRRYNGSDVSGSQTPNSELDIFEHRWRLWEDTGIGSGQDPTSFEVNRYNYYIIGYSANQHSAGSFTPPLTYKVIMNPLNTSNDYFDIYLDCSDEGAFYLQRQVRFEYLSTGKIRISIYKGTRTLYGSLDHQDEELACPVGEIWGFHALEYS